MTSSTRTSSTSTAGAPSSSRPRTLALGLGAAAAAAAATAGLALGPTAAEADPGDTYVAIGSSQLLQSEDFDALPPLRLEREQVRLHLDEDFSSCAGEGNTVSDVVGRDVQPLHAYWRPGRGHRQVVHETILQASTPAEAKRFARELLGATLLDCQRRKYDFLFGPTTRHGVGSGSTTWALSYRGKETEPDGGLAVFRKGDKVGVVSVSMRADSTRDTVQTVEGIAKMAVHRLR